MKALKEFDYNLWTTEENGVKKYFVGVKATGEVTEVDAEVMKVLRNEEKKMRRHIEEEGELGAPLSLDSAVGDENNSTWMTDTYNLAEDTEMKCSGSVCSVHTHLPTGSQGIQLHREGV